MPKNSRSGRFCGSHSLCRHIRIIVDGNRRSRGRRALRTKAQTWLCEDRAKPKRLPDRLNKHSVTSNQAKLEEGAAYLNAVRITPREYVGDELSADASKG